MENIHTQFKLVFVLLLATTYTATAFLLSDEHCMGMAPYPCTCIGEITYCNNHFLTDVPHFGSRNTNEYFPYFFINLGENKFTSIPANVFQNLSSLNTSTISLVLANNMISSMDPLAFTGLENNTNILILTHNNLSCLPSAIGKLNMLEELRLEGNPLISIDSSVTAHLSLHLKMLRFDMGHFGTWPTGLSKLNHLQTLTINNISWNHLPLDAFAGLESGLTELTMSYSQLSKIPAAVCHLQNLHRLNFDHNAALESNSSIFEPCSHNLTRLSLLSLWNDSLYSFPDVLQHFPYLTDLDLGNNNIRFIQTSVIPYDMRLLTLRMNNNMLSKIPFALNKLKQLDLLALDNNQITTVEDHDLIGLTNLTRLLLRDNPIEYIARDAFNQNVKLTSLGLSGTKLHLIPEAVRSLPHLTLLNLNFYNNNADCSCKTMSYLKGWNVTAVHMYGRCEYPQSQAANGIIQYLLTDLPNCP